MKSRLLKFVFPVWAMFFSAIAHVSCQTDPAETLSGPDSHETGEGPHGAAKSNQEIICCIGWPARQSGVLIRRKPRAWTRRSRMTGARLTSIETIGYLRLD